MWIMLIKKLPTNPSPPKMSIFWSTPWPKEEIVEKQFKRYFENELTYDNLDDPDMLEPSFYLDEDGNKLSDELLSKKILAFMEIQSNDFYDGVFGFGSDDNWAKARKIEYKGESIRVFSREFTAITHENMALYIGHTDPEQASHELVTSTVAETKLLEEVLEGDLREVYDAALVDGCSHSQAVGMALGIDISKRAEDSSQLAQFPPVGWYRCKPEYASIYCYEDEMAE